MRKRNTKSRSPSPVRPPEATPEPQRTAPGTGGVRAIAARIGVSVATVSRALNGHPRIPAATKARVRAAAAELGYVPSVAVSQALRAVRSRGRSEYRYTVACITAGEPLDSYRSIDVGDLASRAGLPSGWQQLYSMWRGLAGRASEIGVSLDCLSLRNIPPERVAGVLRARNIGTVVLLMRAYDTAQREAIQRLLPQLTGFRGALLGACEVPSLPMPVVSVDLFEAGRRAYLEAWRAGYRKIFDLSPYTTLDPEQRFRAGLRFAAHKTGDPSSLPCVRLAEFDEHFASASADCCYTGSLPDLIWEKCAAAGKGRTDLPGFISWHANLPFVPHRWTGIDQRDEEQARAAIDLAVAGIDPAKSAIGIAGGEYLLQPGWIEGESAPAREDTHPNALPDHPYPQFKGRKWHPVPLRRHHSAVFRQSEAWMQKIPIPALHPGRWVFHGVPFTGEKTSGSSGPGVVLMRSDTHPIEAGRALPERIELAIRRKARAIYFLHGCGYVRREAFACYRVVYRSGDEETVPIVAAERAFVYHPPPEGFGVGANIGDWFPDDLPLSNRSTRPVRLLEVERRTGQAGHIYTFEWINPHPDRTIERIEIDATRAEATMLVLFAVTLAQ